MTHRRILSLFPLLASAASIGGPALAQATATYRPYGHGCLGSSQVASCISLNDIDKRPLAITALGLASMGYVAYPVQAPSALTIEGLSLWTSSSDPNVRSGSIEFHRDLSQGSVHIPHPQVEQVATMAVGAQAAWCTATFATPISVQAGERFWFVQDCGIDFSGFPIIMPSQAENGLAAPDPDMWVLTTTDPTVVWFGEFKTSLTGPVYRLDPAMYRVVCKGASHPATPVLTNSGLPALGQSFDVRLHRALPSSRAVLMFGLSELTPAVRFTGTGAIPCTLFLDPVVSVPAPTDSAGSASVRLSIPNQAALSGVRFYNQFYVIDPLANAFRVSASNAAEGVVR